MKIGDRVIYERYVTDSHNLETGTIAKVRQCGDIDILFDDGSYLNTSDCNVTIINNDD